MTPVYCSLKHNPDAGIYGDCLRACVATILDRSIDTVPHFFNDGCDANTANVRLRIWLDQYGYKPFFCGYPGDVTFAGLLDMMADINPTTHYILYGRDEGDGDHVVVCRGGKMVHNPAWVPGPLIGPGSHGFWTVLVISVA